MFEEYSKLENRGSDEKILFLIFDLFFRVESPPLRDVKERKEILVLSRSIDFNLRKQFERQLEHPRRRTSQLHGAGARCRETTRYSPNFSCHTPGAGVSHNVRMLLI